VIPDLILSLKATFLIKNDVPETKRGVEVTSARYWRQGQFVRGEFIDDKKRKFFPVSDTFYKGHIVLVPDLDMRIGEVTSVAGTRVSVLIKGTGGTDDVTRVFDMKTSEHSFMKAPFFTPGSSILLRNVKQVVHVIGFIWPGGDLHYLVKDLTGKLSHVHHDKVDISRSCQHQGRVGELALQVFTNYLPGGTRRTVPNPYFEEVRIKATTAKDVSVCRTLTKSGAKDEVFMEIISWAGTLELMQSKKWLVHNQAPLFTIEEGRYVPENQAARDAQKGQKRKRGGGGGKGGGGGGKRKKSDAEKAKKRKEMEELIKRDPSRFLDMSKGLDIDTAEEKFDVKRFIDEKGECVHKEHVGLFLNEVLAKVVGPSFTNTVTMAPSIKGDLRKKTLTFTWTVAEDLKLQRGK
jgi:hypothetical protein